MKTTLLLLMPIVTFGLLFSGCNRKQQHPNTEVSNAFKARYPKAQKAEWESKEGFYVVEFRHADTENEAWFDDNGHWTLTKSEPHYKTLPQAIRTNLENSNYHTWKRDEIIKIERPYATPVYIIEVEKDNQGTNLFYTERGQLIRAIPESNTTNALSFSPIPNQIQSLIKQKYPQAIILDMDRKNGRYEIDIIDQGQNKEVWFNGNIWLGTSWKVKKNDVPNLVMESFRKSTYKKFRIEDIYFFETPVNNYYQFELEHNDQEVYLSIDSKGNILKEQIKD